jgi:hypothetical protein
MRQVSPMRRCRCFHLHHVAVSRGRCFHLHSQDEIVQQVADGKRDQNLFLKWMVFPHDR